MKKSLLVFSLLLMGFVLTGGSCVSFSSNSKSVATGPSGVFMSNDKGDTWKSSSLWPTAEGVKKITAINIYRVVDDPSDPNAMYLATKEHGVFYTYDNGTTWQQFTKPFNAGFAYAVAVNPSDKCDIYVSNGNQVYKTDDCGRFWKEVYREARQNVRIASLNFNFINPYEIFMGISNGDLLKSADKGVSWSMVHSFKTVTAGVVMSKLDPEVMFMATRSSGLYRSIDSGKTWVSLKTNMKGFSKALEYRRFALHPTDPKTLYWISTYGILVSKDNGDTWTDLKLVTPPGTVNIYAFTVNPKNDKEMYYTATVNDRSTFYKSDDGGATWITKKMPTGQIPVFIRVNPSTPETLFMGFTMPPAKK